MVLSLETYRLETVIKFSGVVAPLLCFVLDTWHLAPGVCALASDSDPNLMSWPKFAYALMF